LHHQFTVGSEGSGVISGCVTDAFEGPEGISSCITDVFEGSEVISGRIVRGPEEQMGVRSIGLY